MNKITKLVIFPKGLGKIRHDWNINQSKSSQKPDVNCLIVNLELR